MSEPTDRTESDAPAGSAPGAEPPPIPEPDPEGCSAAALGLPVRAWDTAVILLLTVVADVCLYSHPGGCGLGVLLLVTVIGLLSAGVARARHASPSLLVGIVLIAAASIWNHWWLLTLTGWLAVLGFAVKLYRPDWRITELCWTVPWTALLAPVRLLGHWLRLMGYGAEPRSGEVKHARRLGARVVVVPLVLTLLFVIIFTAAHPVLREWAAEFFRWLDLALQDFWKLLVLDRILTWVFWLLLFAALIRPVTRSWFADWRAKRSENLERPRDLEHSAEDYLTALITLICLNLVFLMFNAFDSVHLYFRAALPRATSYAEYSHNGCWWLTGALALSTAVIGVMFDRGLNFHPRKKILTVLAYIWAAQNGVLAAGALRRIEMYISHSGLTRLRLVGIYGVLLVVVGLALMVWKVARMKNSTWLVRRDLLAFWMALVVLAVTPRDHICWTHNAARIMDGKFRTFVHLYKQPMSPESYPPLIRLLDHKKAWVRDGIAGLLGRKLVELRAQKLEKWTLWQGSQYWAWRRLEAAADKIRSVAPPDHWEAAEEAMREKTKGWL